MVRDTNSKVFLRNVCCQHTLKTINMNDKIKEMYNEIPSKGAFIYMLAQKTNRSVFTVRNNWFNPVCKVPVEFQETAITILKSMQND